MLPLQILLALHDPATRPGLADALRSEGLQVTVRENLVESFAAARDEGPDAVLLAPLSRDADSPEFRGLMELAAEADGPALVVLTDDPRRLDEHAARIDDFVGPDDDLQQLARRLRYSAARRASLRRLHRERQELSRAAVTDFKTGLSNDRHFDACCRVEAARAERDGRPLGVLLIDLDEFKRINDEHDHGFGDHVLRVVADTLKDGLRPFDTAARIGGDEFAVLLPNTPAHYVRSIAERVRLNVAALALEADGHSDRITVTIGGSSWTPDDGRGFAEALKAADQALLHAKRAGRNRTRVPEADGAAPPGPATLALGDDPRPPREA